MSRLPAENSINWLQNYKITSLSWSLSCVQLEFCSGESSIQCARCAIHPCQMGVYPDVLTPLACDKGLSVYRQYSQKCRFNVVRHVACQKWQLSPYHCLTHLWTEYGEQFSNCLQTFINNLVLILYEPHLNWEVCDTRPFSPTLWQAKLQSRCCPAIIWSPHKVDCDNLPSSGV